MNRWMTGIGNGQSERFVVDWRQSVRDSFPSENSFFCHFGVAKRISQPEGKLIFIQCRNDVFKHLTVVSCRFQSRRNDWRSVVGVDAPRLRLFEVTALTEIMRINFAVRIARIVQVANIFAIRAQWPAVFFDWTRSTTGMVNREPICRCAVTDSIVADPNFQVKLFTDIVQHLAAVGTGRQ